MTNIKIEIRPSMSLELLRALQAGDTEVIHRLLSEYLIKNRLQLPEPLMGPGPDSNVVSFPK